MEPPPVQYVTTSDGYDIAYCISGEGRQLVLMPRPFSNLRADWESITHGPTLEMLAAHFKLIQYDCRGEGMSTRGLPDNLTLDHLELDLEAVMDKCGLEPVILSGQLVSGNVAVQYTVHHPERVAALVVRGINLDDPLENVRWHLETSLQSWENYLKTPAFNLFQKDPPMQAFDYLKGALSKEDFIKRMNLPPTSLRPLLGEISCPTLVVSTRGSDNPRISREDEARITASLIPGAKLAVFNPGQVDFASVLVSFVATLPPPLPATKASGEAATCEGPVADASGLTPREIEVLRLIAAGRTNQQIADRLVISLNTVLRHVTNILTKTESNNRAEATSYAHRNHLI